MTERQLVAIMLAIVDTNPDQDYPMVRVKTLLRDLEEARYYSDD